MKILVPDYLLESVMRHYKSLAEAYRPDGHNTKAHNAQRVAGREIQKIRTLMDKQKKENGGF